MLLLDSSIQTAISRYAGQQLEKITHSRVNIGKIAFKPFKTLELKDIYVSDDHKDTLIYLHNLKANINWVNFKETYFWLHEATIDSAKIYFVEDSTGTLNFNRFIDAFGTDTLPEDTSSSGFTLRISKMEITRTSFRVKSYGAEKLSYGINFEDMFLQKMNLSAEDFIMDGADIFMKIKHFSSSEQSGFNLDELSGEFSMDGTGIQFFDYKIAIDSTTLEGEKQGLLFDDWEKFSDFENNIRFDSRIDKGRLRTDDLALIIPDFNSYKLDINLSGQISGTLAKLRGKDVVVKITDSTFLKSSFALDGMPDIENTIMNIDIHELTGFTKDLSKITFLTDEDGNTPIPEYIQWFKYTGNAKGLISDIDNHGQIKTNIGTITTHVALKMNERNDFFIKGNIGVYNLAVNTIAGDSATFGKTSLSTNIDASIFSNGEIKADLLTNISYIDLNNYRLKNIDIDGLVTHEAFDGNITVHDSALDMNFTGHFEYDTDDLYQKVLINIHHADLWKLKLDTDSTSQIKCDIMAHFKGIDPSIISGHVSILDLSYKRGLDSIQINELAIGSNQHGYQKQIQVISDFFNIDLSGHYNITELSPALSGLVFQYAPDFAWDHNPDIDEKTEFQLGINLKNIQPLLKLFVPGVAISNNTNITGRFSHSNQQLFFEGKSDLIEAEGVYLENLRFRTFNEREQIHTSIGMKKFQYTSQYALKNLSVNTILQRDSVDLNLNWSNFGTKDSALYSGNITTSILYGNIDSLEETNYKIRIQPSFFVVADTLWSIEKCEIEVDSTTYSFGNFFVENRFQHLSINGKISENPDDTLMVVAENVNISPVNLFTSSMGLNLEGILNAKLKLTQVYSNFFLGSSVNLDKLTINGQLIGDTEISTSWDPFLEMIHLEWLSTIRDMDALNVVGDYDPSNGRMNFRLFIDRFNLSIVEPYLEGVLHDLEGLTTAEIIIKGKTDNPQLRGVVIFDRTAFTLDYTQTRYEITDWFDISPNAFYFNDLRITDIYDHYGHINGKITHENFDKINFDINFDSRNLMFLNTLQKDNDTFFGTVYASGNTNVAGSLEDMNIDISMQTDKNTKVFIPLESSEEVSEVSFIQFKYIDTTLNNIITKKEEPEEEEGTMSLNMNLTITPETEVQIIFDSKVGDIIKARGSADLNINMPPTGDISIYGDYIIDEGDYLFTLQDVFQKHLTIAKGSKVSLAGDPMDAVVDIDAIYRVRRASIYDLTFNQDHQELVVPVETHLTMTGGLETPTIGFNLNLPSTIEEVQEQLNNLPQEDMNKQVLSLLVMNRFLPLPGAQQQTKTESFGVENNASELLSNQVSNWLSQISGTVDFGFNYTPGDEVETREYEFAVSTQLLNNRVTIQSNLGVGGQQVSQTGETENASNIAGDFQVDIKLDQTGKFRVKAFAKSNDDINNEATTQQGLGVFYKEEFNSFGELWRKIFGSKDKNENTTE